MKILQNETTTNTTAAANSSTTTKEKEKLLQNQQHQQFIVDKRKAKTLKNKILQNVAQQLQQQQQQQQQQHQHSQQRPSATTTESETTTASAIAMTDEISAITTTSAIPDTNDCNNVFNSFTTSSAADITSKDLTKDLATSAKSKSNNTNTNNNNSSNSNSSDFIIAEAAKILLKNGLNGSNAAAAAAVATATATLLTAAANFQLPHQQQELQHQQTSTQHSSTTSTTSSLASSSSLSSKSPVLESAAVAANATTAAAAAHAQLVAIAAAAAAVNATNNKRLTALSSSNSNNLNTTKACPSNQQLNNGTTSVTSSSTDSSSSARFATPFKSSSNSHIANIKSTAATTMSSMDMGVIDYTINSAATTTNNSSSNSLTTSTSSPPSSVINLSTSSATINSHKYLNNSNNNNNNSNHSHHLNRADIGRPPISSHPSINNHNHNHAASGGVAGSFGGRLQFFKDGKFILELARSKDGEKSGWVSVPRKVFRTPSAATSSTVTPSATASTAAATIPTSLTAPSPTAVIGISAAGVSYPKNECSNSLSYSDDNSSLQSSPWQRDHRWKQAAPRKNVSKEMTQFYHKPACRSLTAQALLLTQRKRRKPYDIKTLENGLLFRLKTTICKEQQQIAVDDKSTTEIEVETKVEGTQDADKKESEEEVGDDSKTNNKIKVSGATIGAKEEIINDVDDKKLPKLSEACNDVEMSMLPSPIKNEYNGSEILNDDGQQNSVDVEKMNTSESDINEEAPNKSPLNGNVSNKDSQKQKVLETTAKEATVCIKQQGDEEKRLTKQDTIKTRAKLTTIVQKLMDASASRVAVTAAHHLFKTSTNSQQQSSLDAGLSYTTSTPSAASAGGGSKNTNFKISPPSSTAASRLVEYHQQHVSPRKRILREFEKVSLEDNAAAAGGKRSRAKGTNVATTSAHGSIPQSQALTSPMNKPSPESGSSYHNNNFNAGNQTKISTSVTSTAPPTKLYSSYSIHSLLGNGSSSCSLSSSPSSSKRAVDLPATITSNSLAYTPYNSSSITHNNAYQPPKSPESGTPTGGGGKSPSNSASKQKRSPPYSSPIRDAHSRSPTINASTSGSVGAYDYGRRSPRVTTEAYNKMKYSGGAENNGSPHHYHHVTQNYYTQYMASPHYAPPLSTPSALSPSTSSGGAPTSNSTSSSRSPRHHSSGGTTNTTQNIPSTQRGDLSPQRSATASPREATPRTVPKKTASIRRQFASPTSISTTTTNSNNTNSSCPSPSMNVENRNEDNDRRTPVSHHQQQQQQQHCILQRASPGGSNMQSSALHPYSYMYATNSPHPPNATHPVSAVSPTSANVSAAAAAAAAAAATYIPAVVGSPYYHPYISTLAAMRHPQMWMQHYQNAAAAAANPALLQASRHPAMISAAAAGAAAARLSPPYHGYQYNGVSNAAALAAAAAAAAGFGSATSASPSHHSAGNTLSHPGSIFNPMVHSLVASHSAAIHAPSGLAPSAALAALGSSAHPMTDNLTTDLSKASKNNYSSSSSSSLASSSPLPGTGISGGNSSVNSMYPISNKDEQSSDVPLNLSKH